MSTTQASVKSEEDKKMERERMFKWGIGIVLLLALLGLIIYVIHTRKGASGNMFSSLSTSPTSAGPALTATPGDAGELAAAAQPPMYKQ